MRFLNFIFTVAMIVLLPLSQVQATSSGRLNASQGVGCNACHSGGIVPTVVLSGPTTVALGSTNSYTFTISGGQKLTGGLNVSVSGGTLVATQPGTTMAVGQISHVTPATADANGQIVFSFDWQAPLVDSSIVIYAAGLSADGSYTTLGDAGATTTLAITVGAGSGVQPVETGQTLYEGNCQTCHGPAPGPKANRTAAQIQAAIDANTGGMNALSGLTPTQVQKIADFLAGGTTAQAPVAVPGGPYTGVTNTQVMFDGSGSTDADGTIVSYSWDFGDGSGTATGATPAYTYVAVGTYTVSLTVTDNSGMTGTTTTTANIAVNIPPPVVYDGVALYGTNCSSCHGALPNSSKTGRTAAQIQTAIDSNTGGMGALASLLPAEVQAISDALSGTSPMPIADPGSAYTGIVGTAVIFDGSGSTDANGTLVSYDWTFGDGTSGTGVSPSHAYTATGTYIVTLAVTDNDGNINSASTTATIGTSSEPPVLDGLALYNTNCAGCHGVAPGDQAGASAADIRSAIDKVTDMAGLSGLTDAELQAIADAITTTPPPASTDGKGLYDTYCSACHGADGSGGSTAVDVRGQAADSILKAIDKTEEMQYLGSLLSDADIALIADYLAVNGDGDVD